MAHGTKDIERPCPPKFQVSDIDLKLHWPPFEIWELINFKASAGAQNAQSGCGVKGERGKQIVSLKKHQICRQCDQFALKNELVLMKRICIELYL
jgi:hypothetical protein